MPFDTPPGQVLSSVPLSSEKRRSSKIGGCAGVLFQIFHGKRLFPRKSLPAERPQHDAITHTDDKLPIAKLLLIAEENRGGPFIGTEEELEEESQVNVCKDEPCEEKATKRTPNVVARLMGLESMPSSEPAFGEKKHIESHRKDMDCQFSSDLPKERPFPFERSWNPPMVVQPFTSLRTTRRSESETSLPEKFTTQRKDFTKSKSSAKKPSLPPHHRDSSFPSLVSSYRKDNSTNRVSMGIQKTTRLLDSAARTFEASPHVNTQTRKQRLLSATSRSRILSFDSAKKHKVQSGREQVCLEPRSQAIHQRTTTAVQSLSNRWEETKTYTGSRTTSNEMMNRRRNVSNASDPELRRPPVGNFDPEQVLRGSRGTLREAATGKSKQGYQQSFTQSKANLLEHAKRDWRRQEELSRKLSQPTTCNGKMQKSKSLGNKHMRHPSPPKSFGNSCGAPCSSQASNSISSSSESMRSSQPISSRISCNNTPSRKFSSSSTRGISALGRNALDGETRPSQSVRRETAGLPHETLSILRIPSVPVSSHFGKADHGSSSQDGSSSSAIYTESHQRSSMESLLSSDPSLSEFTTSSEDCPNFLIGVDIPGNERVEGKCEGDDSSVNEPMRAADIFLSEDSLHSKHELLSVDLGESPSSHPFPDADDRAHADSIHAHLLPDSDDRGHANSIHAHWGKNTSAILQELLKALSSSTTLKEAVKERRAECTECYSSDSDFVKPGELCGNALCIQDFKDSTSRNSSDSSEGLQSSRPCESSMDQTNIVESQAEEDVSANMEETAQTPMERGVFSPHADFGNCEALMNTLSKLHHIDPEAIGLNVSTIKHCEEENVIAGLASTVGFPGGLIDSNVSDKLEKQAEPLDCGLSSSATLSAEADADSMYRSDVESSFRNGYEEVVAQNKKLITDCINEAFKSLSMQLYGVSSSISGHSSASQVLSRVYKQIDEWRGMAISMNLDDMVEKEMNSTTRRWRNIGVKAEEVAEVVESTILSGLMEEVLLELI